MSPRTILIAGILVAAAFAGGLVVSGAIAADVAPSIGAPRRPIRRGRPSRPGRAARRCGALPDLSASPSARSRRRSTSRPRSWCRSIRSFSCSTAPIRPAADQPRLRRHRLGRRLRADQQPRRRQPRRGDHGHAGRQPRVAGARSIGIDPHHRPRRLKVDATRVHAAAVGRSEQAARGRVGARGRQSVRVQPDGHARHRLGAEPARSATRRRYNDFIQTDAAINPGNSGGALVNAAANWSASTAMIYSQTGGYQGIGFAIPVNLARRIMDRADQERRDRARLDRHARRCSTITAEQARGARRGRSARGVIIVEHVPQRAGLPRRPPAGRHHRRASTARPSPSESQLAAPDRRDAPIGSRVKVEVLRDGQRRDVRRPGRSAWRRRRGAGARRATLTRRPTRSSAGHGRVSRPVAAPRRRRCRPGCRSAATTPSAGGRARDLRSSARLTSDPRGCCASVMPSATVRLPGPAAQPRMRPRILAAAAGSRGGAPSARRPRAARARESAPPPATLRLR